MPQNSVESTENLLELNMKIQYDVGNIQKIKSFLIDLLTCKRREI